MFSSVRSSNIPLCVHITSGANVTGLANLLVIFFAPLKCYRSSVCSIKLSVCIGISLLVS